MLSFPLVYLCIHYFVVAQHFCFVVNNFFLRVHILAATLILLKSVFFFLFSFFRDNIATYANDYPTQFILGYCSTYIFMQTFMIPGTIFMSLLAGALFGVKGVFLVVFNATAGACSCFFLSKLIGRPLVSWLWPDKLRFFQAEVFLWYHLWNFSFLVSLKLASFICFPISSSYLNSPAFFLWSQIAKRRDKLLNYMLFLRITPTLPNLFINLASPIVDIPFHVFFLATFVGLMPASYITVKVSILRCTSINSLHSLWFDFHFFIPFLLLLVLSSENICWKKRDTCVLSNLLLHPVIHRHKWCQIVRMFI